MVSELGEAMKKATREFESIGSILGRLGIAPTRAPGIVHLW